MHQNFRETPYWKEETQIALQEKAEGKGADGGQQKEAEEDAEWSERDKLKVFRLWQAEENL